MKELSIEQKAQAYDEALKYANYLINERCKEGTDGSFHRADLDKMFPILAESEDERIRKELIDYFSASHATDTFRGIPWDRVVAWLERQGEQKPTLPKWKYKNDNTPLLRDSIILNKYGCVAKSPSGAIVSDVWVIDYDELAKLPKEEFEKLCEQKADETVAPKFKVGDWIAYNRNDNSREIMQIYDIRDGRYYFTDNVHFSWSIKECDEKSHLWTIQDAKEGDVLFYRGNVKYSDGIKFERILLFENLDKSFFVLTKCSNGVEDYGINEIINYPDNIIPATKEQKEILFMVMKDAGYEWDDEKKELKKL